MYIVNHREKFERDFGTFYAQIKDFLHLIPEIRQLRPKTEVFKAKEAKWDPWDKIYQEYTQFNALADDNPFYDILELIQTESDIGAVDIFEERILCDAFLYFPLMIYLLGLDNEVVVNLAVRCDLLPFLLVSDDPALTDTPEFRLKYPERHFETVYVENGIVQINEPNPSHEDVESAFPEGTSIKTYAGDDLIVLARSPEMLIYLYERPYGSGETLGPYDVTKLPFVTRRYEIMSSEGFGYLRRNGINLVGSVPNAGILLPLDYKPLDSKSGSYIMAEADLDSLRFAALLEYADNEAPQLVEMLLSSTDFLSSGQWKPLGWWLFRQAIDIDSKGAVELFLHHYPQLGENVMHIFAELKDVYPLYRAIEGGNWRVALYLFKHTDWQSYKRDGSSILHAIAKTRAWDLEVIEYLMTSEKVKEVLDQQNRRGLEAPDRLGESPMSAAMNMGNLDALELFEDFGAELVDPRIFTKAGDFEIHLKNTTSEQKEDLENRYKAFIHRAISAGLGDSHKQFIADVVLRAPILLRILLDTKVYDSNKILSLDYGRSSIRSDPLLYAVEHDAIETTEILLSVRVDSPWFRSQANLSDDYELLTAAVSTEMMKILLNAGLVECIMTREPERSFGPSIERQYELLVLKK